MGLSVLMVGIQCIGAILFSDWVPGSEAEFRDAFHFVATISAGVSAMVVLIFGLPWRLKNVFRIEAERRVEIYQSIKREVESQIETTDGLLLSYGMSTQDAIEERRNNAPN